MTAMTGFTPRPPLGPAIDKADRDVRQRASASDVNWLHANPVTWVQALATLRDDVEARLAKAKLGLASLKPALGEQVSAEYLIAKADVETRAVGRRHYLDLVCRRLAEVGSLIGYDTFTFANDARVVECLSRAENALERGDSDEAGDVLAQLLDSIEATRKRLKAAG